MSTTEKRRPLSIEINGHGVVSSSEHYTVDEAADIQRMLVEIFNSVADGREEFRASPGVLHVVKDAGR